MCLDFQPVCVPRKFCLSCEKGPFLPGRSSVEAFLLVFLDNRSLLVVVLGARAPELLLKVDLHGVDLTGSPFVVASV